MAIDRESLVRAVLGGYGKVAHSWLQPQHEGYYAKIRQYPCDRKAAGALLDEVGLRLGADKRRMGPDGKPLVIEIVRAERHSAVALDFIAASLEAIGITVQQHCYPEQIYFREILGQRQYRHLAFYAYVFDPWETGRDTWSIDRIPREENGWKGKNWTGFRNETVSELHRRIDATFNEDERADLYDRQQQIWAEELPALPLYRPEQVLLVAPGLRGLISHAGGEYALPWNAEDWHFSE
jgi:peptide/nickel transport system substrate-binding protein